MHSGESLGKHWSETLFSVVLYATLFFTPLHCTLPCTSTSLPLLPLSCVLVSTPILSSHTLPYPSPPSSPLLNPSLVILPSHNLPCPMLLSLLPCLPLSTLPHPPLASHTQQAIHCLSFPTLLCSKIHR